MIWFDENYLFQKGQRHFQVPCLLWGVYGWVSGWVRDRNDRDRKLVYFTYFQDLHPTYRDSHLANGP